LEGGGGHVPVARLLYPPPVACRPEVVTVGPQTNNNVIIGLSVGHTLQASEATSTCE